MRAMRRTGRMVGVIAAAVVVSVVPMAASQSANAAPERETAQQGQQASPGCVDRQDLAGGRWLTTTLCSFNEVTGYSQVVEREIWLDRTMNLNGGWDGRLGLYTDSYYTAHQTRDNYYWRTCIRDNGGAIYCGRWYNQ